MLTKHIAYGIVALALSGSVLAANTTSTPPYQPPAHGQERPPAPSLAMMLKRALPLLKLTAKQDGLFLKAEQAEASTSIEQAHAAMQAHMQARSKLEDSSISLADAFRSLTVSSNAKSPVAAEWLAFFNSLDQSQAATVRKALLTPPPRPPHGGPEGGRPPMEGQPDPANG